MPAADAANLELHWDAAEERDGRLPSFYFLMHFAEIVPNVSRSLNIYLNGGLWTYNRFSLSYLFSYHIYNGDPESRPSYHFQIREENSSGPPPILNAVEVYREMRRPEMETDRGDVDALLEIKAQYQLKKNWMGDPCTPQHYAWSGLDCSYIISVPPRIRSLNLSFSKLAEEIPVSLAKLKKLSILDLSGNRLTGAIPDFLAELDSLKLLNLSGNLLSGSIPPVLLSRSKLGTLVLSVDGNPDLCKVEGSCDSKKSTTVIAVTIPVVLVAIFLVVAFVFWIMRRRRARENVIPQRTSLFGKIMHKKNEPSGVESRQFTYAELGKITRGFQLKIGKGGFGAVYHGCLEDGTQVAVKLRSQVSAQGSKELINEAQILARVHHRNVVPLVGYCGDAEYMALVYEYMPQGSLEDLLKGKLGSSEVLHWRERLRIAQETAQGLEYLHNGCKPPIIHRDVKPSNILLNEKLEAKIADFGLSKFFYDDSVTHVSTRVIGTTGYIDPQYYTTSQLTEKSDVYSFGVVLLELITGQPAILPRPDQCHIRYWAEQRLSTGDIMYLIDPRLKVEADSNSVLKTIDIAMKATDSKAAVRPTMGSIVAQLKEVVALEASQCTSQALSTEVQCTSETIPFAEYLGGNLSITIPEAR